MAGLPAPSGASDTRLRRSLDSGSCPLGIVRSSRASAISSCIVGSHCGVETTDSFSVALHELVCDSDYVTEGGKPNWAAVASQLDGVHYETLRRVVKGRRMPSLDLIQECARLLKVRPEYFLEYRIALAQRDFDPSVVGLHRALSNLTLWREASTRWPR